MNDTSIQDVIKDRIKECETLKKEVKDTHTLAYLQLLDTLRSDYESLKDKKNASSYADDIIYAISHDLIEYKPTKDNTELVKNIMLRGYDCKARCGDFRAFCIAMEWNRPIKKQFFLPRRRILEKHGLIQAFQDVQDNKVDFLCVNLPPRIGKSTLGLFFLAFRCGLYPDLAILGNGHSSSLTQSFYNEMLQLFTSDEYRFSEIFYNTKIVKKSSEYSWIDLNQEKRFHTIMFRSVDGGTTGLAEASNVLYCDDLVKDAETANNPDRLDNLFHAYTSTIQDRKVPRECDDGITRDCPEIHINTPWSINDVTSRLIRIYGDDGKNPRVKIISIPCYDENGESNFLYDYGKGFTKEYYHSLQKAEDPIIFSAKYLMMPLERDGLVFNENNISTYTSLPSEKPDRIVAYGDVSHGGQDYFSLPIGYVYGRDIYIEDLLFENNFGGDDYIRPKVVDIIIKNNVTKLGVEKNNGGDFFSTIIDRDLKRKNYRCNITTHNAPTTKSKNDRILSCQNEIKGIATSDNTYRIYFKSYDLRKPSYQKAMQQLFNWNQNPKMKDKQHDDFPDSLSGMITNVLNGKGQGRAMSNFSASKLGL